MDLLNLFELKPQTFADRQLNIPESGNGIPDILDEAEYGLLVWKKSMKQGGVAGLLDTNGRPTINDPKFSYFYSLRTRWASLLYAAAAAQYAELVKPFNGQKAAEYEASAKEAYVWGTNPKNSLGTITVSADRERERKPPVDITCTANDNFNKPFLIATKMSSFVLTNV